MNFKICCFSNFLFYTLGAVTWKYIRLYKFGNILILSTWQTDHMSKIEVVQ